MVNKCIRIIALLNTRLQQATVPPHKGKYYCKITLAVADGWKAKQIVSGSELKAILKVKWFKKLESQICEKNAVATTDGKDGRHLVILVERDNYAEMILAFFAMKVWVLRERLNPYWLTFPE